MNNHRRNYGVRSFKKRVSTTNKKSAANHDIFVVDAWFASANFKKLPNFFRLFLPDDCSRKIESFIY